MGVIGVQPSCGDFIGEGNNEGKDPCIEDCWENSGVVVPLMCDDALCIPFNPLVLVSFCNSA